MIKARYIVPRENGGSSEKKSRFSKLLQAGPSKGVVALSFSEGFSGQCYQGFTSLQTSQLYPVALYDKQGVSI